ncbi:MAG: O-antigen ligase family protein [Candidatus Omnitrophica bacterium]|nr:O-antigen ligase family protein [Candidatus Omnitrophota bacterium]
MYRDNAQVNFLNVILGVLLTILLSLSVLGLPKTFFLLLAFSFFIFLISFAYTDFAFLFLIFSIFLSPEIKLGMAGGREVVLRMDDVFLFVVFFGWLARLAVNKEMGLLKTNPLNRPLLVYIFISLVATLLGVLRGYAKLNISIFYLLKYFEYYLLFFMVTNHLKDKKQMKAFIFYILVVSLLISLYGFIMHLKGVERVTAPFEGDKGEANTLGGYLVFILMLATSFFIHSDSIKERLFLSLVLLLGYPTLIFTLSRGSWLAFIPAFITLILLTRRAKLMLILISVLLVLLSPFIFPRYFFARIHYTFLPGRHFVILGKAINLEESAAARIEVFKAALKRWVKEPILGYGIGSPSPILDNQYARLMLEVGSVGMLGFFWVIFTIFKYCLNNLKDIEDRFATSLITGFLAGLVGLLVHGLSAETFIIIRIMEPFWFLTAMVVRLSDFYS